MSNWHLHLLNARHDLTPVLAEIRAALRLAASKAAGHATVPDFDLVVRAGSVAVGPDGGLWAEVTGPGIIEVTLLPGRYDEGALVRALLRRMFQLIRWDAVGAPRSLGDVLVGEGLAAHFVADLHGGASDPLDETRPPSGLARQAMTEWARLKPDQGRWFQGRGDLRRGAGNGLAYRLIAMQGEIHPGMVAVQMAGLPADQFLPALRRLVGAETQPDPAATSLRPDTAGTSPQVDPDPSDPSPDSSPADA